MKCGSYTIQTIDFGAFRLDGGCMFGSVPKNLWSRSISADAENCIPLVCRSLLLKGHSRTILVDVGIGNKWSDKLRAVYGISLTDARDLGFTPEEITDVVLTHLHFDHAGGISYVDGTGALRLTYPNARIHLQVSNWNHAQHPTAKDRASYLADNIEPLRNSKLTLYDGTIELFPGMYAHKVDGHTPGQQWIEVVGDDQSVFFPTDLIPTSHHVPLAYHMGYDVCASTLLEEKLHFLERATRENALVCFQHDAQVSFAYIRAAERGGYVADPAVL